MKRLLVAAPALALALSLTATPAQAAAVKDKDVVPLATVAQSYPGLSDGERAVVALKNVQAATSCKKATSIKVKSGRSAAYTSTTDTTAPIVGVDVAQMKSVKVAKRVIKGDRIISGCKRVTQDGVTATVKKIAAPKLGQERVGLSITITQGEMTMVVDTYSFRQKARLVEMSVIYIDGEPQRKKSAALAKKVYKAGL